MKPTGDIILPVRHQANPLASRVGPLLAPAFGDIFSGLTSDSWADVHHYRLWNYVAISAIAEKVGQYLPNVSIVRAPGASANKQVKSQRYSARRLDYARRHYGATLQMTEQEELHEVPRNHRLVQLFKHVNSEEWWSVFIFETIMFRRLTGAAYWWLIPDGTGRPAELWVIPTQWMDPPDGVRDPRTGERKYWRIVPDGYAMREIKLPADEVLPWWEKNPLSKVKPHSPSRACAEWIQNAEAAEGSRAIAFQNSAHPSVAIEFETGDRTFDVLAQYDEQLISQVGERFMQRYAGIKRTGEPLVVPPGFRYKPWSLSPKEMDYPNSIDQLRDMVLAIHKTPKIAIGIGTDVNRASAIAQLMAWCEFVIRPLQYDLAGLLTEKLAPRFDPRLRVWFDDCTPRDEELMIKVADSRFAHGSMTPNEERTMWGDEPLEGEAYDVGYLPLGLVPVGADLEPLPPDPESNADDEKVDPDPSEETDTDDEPDEEEIEDDDENPTDRRQSGGRSRLRPERNGHAAANGLATLSLPGAPAILTPSVTWRARRVQRVHTLFLRQHARHERRAAVSLRRFWRELQTAVEERLAQSLTIPDIDTLLPDAEFREKFNAAMSRHWEAALLAGSEIERVAVGSVAQADEDPSIFVRLPEKAKRFVRQFLRDRTAGVWAQIKATAKAALQRAITKGVTDGDGIAEVRKRITDQLNVSRRQAERIARTEITAGLNGGQQSVRDAEGIEKKLWIATLDDKTRTPPDSTFDHVRADGQEVSNAGTFTVSGERLEYPGDTSHGASAGNVVNCRCSSSASVDL